MKRIIDLELLDCVRNLPCLACGVVPCGQAHHVTTRGAGGHDLAENLMPLCGVHHAEWHRRPYSFIAKHRSVRYWLEGASRWDVLDRFYARHPALAEIEIPHRYTATE